MSLSVYPLPSMQEVRPGDDLARLIVDAVKAAGLELEASDVLVVTQKIVSKAEGRLVDLATVTVGARAKEVATTTGKDPRLVELVLAESRAVLRAVKNVLITRHLSGHVMANAGIDRSNIGPGDGDRALLLPVDADASAERLRTALQAIWPASPAVLISDSFGRAWRQGVTGAAIGAAGLPALIDRRGERDRDGRVLEVTQTAFGDLIASAAALVTGEGAEGIAAVLVRGLHWTAESRPAADLIRPEAEDLFR